MIYDFLIIGGGIIGLTIAIEVRKTRGGTVCIIEKEREIGLHASGRNSGVLHAGIYYKPGTLKANLAVEGNRVMREYCLEKDIKQIKGKVIVTKHQGELETLKTLEKRAIANGAEVKVIDTKELKEIEPYARTIDAALYSPKTITIDPKEVIGKLLEDARSLDIKIMLDTRMIGLSSKNTILTNNGKIGYGHLINAAGAYADKIAHMFNVGMQYVMIPYKGIYFHLKNGHTQMVRSNIYPVPDIRFPFLGVHFTRTPGGVVKIGPTAIPALSRENYSFLDNINISELGEAIYCNTKKLLSDKNYVLLGLKETTKYVPYLFYKDAKQLLPKLEYSHIASYPKVGIRAQLFDKTKNDLEMDFIILKQDNSLHVLNAVSPAFTSSITFAKHVVGTLS